VAGDRWERIESLCHAALARPASERLAFLAEACADDAELRHEVESLIASAESSFLETPVNATASPVGQQLGAYRILQPIGAGGMGEVFRARDTRLGRDVAVKILPAAWAADPQRRARFEREAQAIAALNHPNICTIHDVGHDRGIDFLVMELVDGVSLAARLTRGPLPFDSALARAIEIADALDKAHRQGIIHRDLKPANVMLVKAGSSKAQSDQAKLLDFGLARMAGAPAVTGAATLTEITSMTAPGAVLGTLQYMAPEQIEGRTADARTDIFAFGALLYEMLTARRAFEGVSSPDLIAAIMRDDPPSLESVKPPPPRTLTRVVETCLAKDPDDRYSTVHDLLLELRGIQADAREPLQTTAGSAVPTRRRSWPLAAGLAASIGLAGFWLGMLNRPPQTPAEQTSLDLVPPQGTTSFGGFALSPDGRTLAVVAYAAAGTHIWIRNFSSEDNQRLPGTEDGVNPFWSPDGRSLAFFSNGRLKRMDLPDGKPFAICPAAAGRGGAWFDDGTIVFAPDAFSGLMRVSAKGGEPVLLAPLDKSRGERSLRFPTAVGRRRVLYLAQHDDESMSELRLLNLDAPAASISLVRTTKQGVYADGRIFYDRQAIVVAQTLDAETGTMSGEPMSVTGSVVEGYTGQMLFTAGAKSIAWWKSRPGLSQLEWLDRAGRKLGSLGEPEALGSLDLSPDDRFAAVVKILGNQGDIWILDTTSNSSEPLVEHHASDQFPVWSPDGSRVAFQSLRGAAGNMNLYVAAIGNRSPTETIAEAPTVLRPAGWTPDGRTFAWIREPLMGSREPYALQVRRVDSTESPVETLAELPFERAQVSPDGAMVAYTLREAGQMNLYVDRFPALGSRHLVARQVGRTARWRADSRELFFTTGNDVMAASIVPGVTPTAGSATVLFHALGENWDVTRDGSRFLFAVRIAETLRTISVIRNWSPAGKR